MWWIGLIILGIAGAAIVGLWHRVLAWAENSLFPWIKRNLPELEVVVRQAFKVIDKVAVNIRRSVKIAWEYLRKWLLKQTVEIERRTDNKWIRRITSWIIKELSPVGDKPRVAKIVTEEEIEWDELPDEVRERWITMGKIDPADITKLRDKELGVMELNN